MPRGRHPLLSDPPARTTSPLRQGAGAGCVVFLAHARAAWYARIMRCHLGPLALLAASLTAGCAQFFGDGSGDAHNPGTDLGSFSVTATVTSNTCGEGALGEQASWTFPVRLSRDIEGGALYWNNGQAAIAGALSDDAESFSFDTSVIENMRDPSVVGPPPCSIARADIASGKLDTAKGAVGSFTGTLSYQFAPTVGSVCDDLVDSETPIVAQFPCGFSYDMKGTAAQ